MLCLASMQMKIPVSYMFEHLFTKSATIRFVEKAVKRYVEHFFPIAEYNFFIIWITMNDLRHGLIFVFGFRSTDTKRSGYKRPIFNSCSHIPMKTISKRSQSAAQSTGN
jgi:hypothetical protein